MFLRRKINYAKFVLFAKYFFIFLLINLIFSFFISYAKDSNPLAIFTIYFRFFIFLFSLILIDKIVKKEVGYTRNFKIQCLIGSMLILLFFNILFPISMDTDSALNTIANWMLSFVFIICFTIYYLNNSVNNLVVGIKVSTYKILSATLKIIVITSLRVKFFLSNVIIKIKLSLRKQINFLISNFKKTIYIKHVVWCDQEQNYDILSFK